MKIEYKEKAFQPITIIIESERELTNLLLRLNTPVSDVCKYQIHTHNPAAQYNKEAIDMFNSVAIAAKEALGLPSERAIIEYMHRKLC